MRFSGLRRRCESCLVGWQGLDGNVLLRAYYATEMLPMTLVEIIAANLKTLRELRGLGQHEVAERIGVRR